MVAVTAFQRFKPPQETPRRNVKNLSKNISKINSFSTQNAFLQPYNHFQAIQNSNVFSTWNLFEMRSTHFWKFRLLFISALSNIMRAHRITLICLIVPHFPKPNLIWLDWASCSPPVHWSRPNIHIRSESMIFSLKMSETSLALFPTLLSIRFSQQMTLSLHSPTINISRKFHTPKSIQSNSIPNSGRKRLI